MLSMCLKYATAQRYKRNFRNHNEFQSELHLICNDKGELLNFCITPANTDDRDLSVINPLIKKLSGKLYGDKGYISAALTELLFQDGLHLVTGIKNNMKNRLMTLRDKILLRKRSVIETIKCGKNRNPENGLSVPLQFLHQVQIVYPNTSWSILTGRFLYQNHLPY